MTDDTRIEILEECYQELKRAVSEQAITLVTIQAVLTDKGIITEQDFWTSRTTIGAMMDQEYARLKAEKQKGT